MRRLVLLVVLVPVASSACFEIEGPTGCSLEACGVNPDNPVPEGRSGVCDYDIPDTPRRFDHCLLYDGVEGSGLYGNPTRNCDEPGRIQESAANNLWRCTALKDPFVGGDVTTCTVEGVPWRCMWIPIEEYERWGSGP